jgi:hypothetical protein
MITAIQSSFIFTFMAFLLNIYSYLMNSGLNGGIFTRVALPVEAKGRQAK